MMKMVKMMMIMMVSVVVMLTGIIGFNIVDISKDVKDETCSQVLIDKAMASNFDSEAECYDNYAEAAERCNTINAHHMYDEAHLTEVTEWAQNNGKGRNYYVVSWR